jgi:hypothetical protein
MSRAGFDPAALLHYVEREQPPDQSRVSLFPPLAERIATFQEAIRDLPSAAYSGSDEFYIIQEQARGPQRPPLPPKIASSATARP